METKKKNRNIRIIRKREQKIKIKTESLGKKSKKKRNQFSTLNLILGKWATLAVNVRLRTMPGWFDSYVIVQI